MYYKSAANVYQLMLITAKEDLCEYLNQTEIGDSVVNELLFQWSKYGNFDHSCPYTVRNLTFFILFINIRT